MSDQTSTAHPSVPQDKTQPLLWPLTEACNYQRIWERLHEHLQSQATQAVMAEAMIPGVLLCTVGRALVEQGVKICRLHVFRGDASKGEDPHRAMFFIEPIRGRFLDEQGPRSWNGLSQSAQLAGLSALDGQTIDKAEDFGHIRLGSADLRQLVVPLVGDEIALRRQEMEDADADPDFHLARVQEGPLRGVSLDMEGLLLAARKIRYESMDNFGSWVMMGALYDVISEVFPGQGRLLSCEVERDRCTSFCLAVGLGGRLWNNAGERRAPFEIMQSCLPYSDEAWQVVGSAAWKENEAARAICGDWSAQDMARLRDYIKPMHSHVQAALLADSTPTPELRLKLPRA